MDPRTVEAYLRGSTPPRYMQRLVELEAAYQAHCRSLSAAYAELALECGGRGHVFAERWLARVRRWSFEDLNELIREHNQWYPVEVDLPMSPRTRDFVPIRGASYRRRELGADWVLEHFPASLDAGEVPVAPPRRAPREPL